jgi:15-cis-phytoene synthase
LAPSPAAQLTRRSGTNFYYAFLLLPAEKRQAIYALYAFCRGLDDCVDEPDGGGEEGLRRLLAEIDRAYAGTPQSELGRELAVAVQRFPIPRACFDDVADGCRMDLGRVRYDSARDLEVYCRRVASAVGLASIEIFGYRDPQAKEYAVELGLALQLTNILRDVAADAARDRLYIPLGDLQRFGLTADEFLAAATGAAPAPPALREVLAFEAGRAHEHFARAAALLPAADRRAMAAAEVMGAVYRALLDTMVRRGHPLLPRVRLSAPRKAWIALRTLLRVRSAR